MPGTELITTKQEKKNDATIEPHVCDVDLGDADAQHAHENPGRHQHARHDGALHVPSLPFAAIKKTPVPALIAADGTIVVKERRSDRGHRRPRVCHVRSFQTDRS